MACDHIIENSGDYDHQFDFGGCNVKKATPLLVSKFICILKLELGK